MTDQPPTVGPRFTAQDYLRFIAEGYEVIEATGQTMTIQSPDDEGPQELVINVDDLAPAALDEAVGLLRIKACMDSLDGAYGFNDDEPVDTRHFGPDNGGYNHFSPLTWGDLRSVRVFLANLEPSQ